MEHLRFTARNMLIATTWFCLWCVALVSYLRFIDYPTQPRLSVMVAVWLYIVMGPCITIGALFGNAIRGFQVGIGVVGVIIVMLLLTRLLASVFGQYNFQMPRFTIRTLLVATFWLASWGTAFVLFKYDGPDLFRFVLALLIVAGPFMVAGSSVGKTLGGAKCSAIAISLFFLWYWLNDYPLLIGNS